MYKISDRFSKKINYIRRINIFLFVFILLFIGISIRLADIQIVDSEKYKYTAKKQSQAKEIIVPPRGLIFDRNMNLLVSNTNKITVTADPFRIKNPDSVAILMASVFNKDKNAYYELLSNKNNPNVFLERKADLVNLKGLDTLKIDGLNVIIEPSRIYNLGSLASQVLGFTDMENKGVSGVELAFNKELTGKEGYMIMQKDGRGFKRPDLSFTQKEPEQGDNIILTIDKNIQQFAEEELEKGVKNFNADKGKVIVISIKTGEILGMSSYPTYNPNSIKSEDSVGMKNSVLTDIYEPGSTFKIITAAGCLEENLFTENSTLSTENGTYTIYGMKITDSYPYSSLTFQQIIERSSNIGVAKLSQKLGQERFYKYARDFGMGIYSGVELRGENKGFLKRPYDFTNGSLEFMAIGYQVAVNLLQISMAYSSIANNGMLMKPYIVKKQLTPDGKVIYENVPSMVRQVVSEQTSRRLTQIFTGVVERGTGTDARISGLPVAGKTGTTQRIVEGEYSSKSHISSFVGYFPANNPVILIAVVLDDPKSGEFYGGKVAAPIFQKIATRIISYNGSINNGDFLNVSFDKQNDFNSKDAKNEYKVIPSLLDLKIDDAIDILKERKFKWEINPDYKKEKSNQKNYKTIIISQFPNPDEKVNINDNILIKLTLKDVLINNTASVKIPNVKSYSLRRAINKLITEGFTVEVVGSGEVVDQIPKPGSEINSKSKIILFCKNEF